MKDIESLLKNVKTPEVASGQHKAALKTATLREFRSKPQKHMSLMSIASFAALFVVVGLLSFGLVTRNNSSDNKDPIITSQQENNTDEVSSQLDQDSVSTDTIEKKEPAVSATDICTVPIEESSSSLENIRVAGELSFEYDTKYRQANESCLNMFDDNPKFDLNIVIEPIDSSEPVLGIPIEQIVYYEDEGKDVVDRSQFITSTLISDSIQNNTKRVSLVADLYPEENDDFEFTKQTAADIFESVKFSISDKFIHRFSDDLITINNLSNWTIISSESGVYELKNGTINLGISLFTFDAGRGYAADVAWSGDIVLNEDDSYSINITNDNEAIEECDPESIGCTHSNGQLDIFFGSRIRNTIESEQSQDANPSYTLFIDAADTNWTEDKDTFDQLRKLIESIELAPLE